jgi:hypothetical protein
VASPDGLLIVDYSATGRPVGVEITVPLAVPLERLNQLLAGRSRSTVSRPLRQSVARVLDVTDQRVAT